jgi:hypothetical protein
VSAWLIGAAAVLVVAELTLWALHHHFRQRFQWLIGRADVTPEIDDALVEKHLEGGFDPDLGWVRKPGTNGIDQTVEGPRKFAVDARGRRADPVNSVLASGVAVFGDSYAFCRLVSDDETWPHYLSRELGRYAANYGVGNYGLDQAMLRWERESADLEEQVIVLAVVPETMARIHSYWKHYFEYGNVLAFKPRFTVDAGALTLHPQAVRTAADYRRYRDRLAEIQALDPFYQTKFRHDIFAFPRLLGLFARARRLAPIFWHLMIGGGEGGRRRAFDTVLRRNAEHTGALYDDPKARNLFRALVQRFGDRCRAEGRAPLLVFIPQPVDLARQQRGLDDYRGFLNEIRDLLPIVDMTAAFLEAKDWRRLYVEGPLGPHVGPEGNRMIAHAVAVRVADVIADRRQATA